MWKERARDQDRQVKAISESQPCNADTSLIENSSIKA